MKAERKTKKQLLQELEQERERSDALYQISNQLAGAHDTDEVLDLIVNESARFLGAHASFIRLLERDVLVAGAATESAAALLADSAVDQPSLGVGEGVTALGHVMATKKPLIVEGLTKLELATSAQRLIMQKHGFHGAVAVPLLANGRSIGVLIVIDKRIRRFTDDEVSLLTAFADQASLALEKARLLNEAEREKERSDALYQISNQLAGAHDTDEVLELIVNEASRLVGSPFIILRLLQGDVLVSRANTEAAAPFAASVPVYNVEEGTSAAGHVMATKKPLIGEAVRQMVPPEDPRVAEEGGFYATAAFPLLAEDRSIGTLAVADRRVRDLTADEVSLLAAFADQASLALEKARLLNEAERERERSDALYQISNQLAGAHDTDEVLKLIVNEASRLVGSPFIILRLLQGDVLVPRANTEAAATYVTGVPVRKVEEGSGLSGHAMATKKPLIGDASRQMLSAEAAGFLEEHGFYRTAVFPLLADDRSIGTLSVADRHIRNLTEDEVSLLAAFADQASLALEKARLLQEAETREREATQLYEITTQLASSPDMDSVLELISVKAVELIGSEASALWKYDDARGGLVVVRGHNVPAGWAEVMLAKPGDATTGRAFQERAPVWSRDIHTDPAWTTSNPELEQITRDTSIGGALAVPIIIRDEVYGALNTFFYEPHDFTEGEIQLMQTLADSAAVAINNARFIDQTQQAREDAEARERQTAQLYEVTAQLASNHDLDSVLDLITQQATELMSGRGGVIFKFDEERGGLVVATMYGLVPEMKNFFLRPGEGVAGRTFQKRRVIWSDDRLNDPSAAMSDPESNRLAENLASDWAWPES